MSTKQDALLKRVAAHLTRHNGTSGYRDGEQRLLDDVKAALASQPADASTELVPHTYAGFCAGFMASQHGTPSGQQIFDAGMRAGRDLQWPHPAAAPAVPDDWNAAIEAAADAMCPMLRSMLSRGEAVEIILALKRPIEPKGE